MCCTCRYSSVYGRSTNHPYRNLTPISSSCTYQSAYVPYYRRKQEQNERRDRERAGEPVIATPPAVTTKGITLPTSTATTTTKGPTPATMTLPGTTTPLSTTSTVQNAQIATSPTTTSTITSTTPSSNYITSYRRLVQPCFFNNLTLSGN